MRRSKCQFLQKTRYFWFHRTSTGKFYFLPVLMSEQLVRVTADRCYLCETKVCLLVHSRNRNERLDHLRSELREFR